MSRRGHDLIFVDFEATCAGDRQQYKPSETEIIEWPAIILRFPENGQPCYAAHSFRMFVRPVINPVLSPFCRELTGITQEHVECAAPFEVAMRAFGEFVRKYALPNFTFVTHGRWDFEVCLANHPFMPRSHAIPSCFNEGLFEYVDLRVMYNRSNGFALDARASLADMCTRLDIKPLGKAHSGIDDCTNMVLIFTSLFIRGHRISRSHDMRVVNLYPRWMSMRRLEKMERIRRNIETPIFV